ncbi:MAG: hypothetical protein HOV80_35590, partial [Polyangiaceae bacterium]|nr:hypothetical protein [Polyangiaceae bacterium]
MRTPSFLVVPALLLATVGLVASACKDKSHCDYVTCDEAAGGAGGEGGSTATTMTTTSSMNDGGGGGGGSIDPGCVPRMMPTGASVPEDCGIFVSFTATGDGTKASPMGDLQAALDMVPTNKAVYICGDQTGNGAFTVAGGRSIFGGLFCGDWTYDETLRPRLGGLADLPALRVTGSGVTKLEDFDVAAIDAMALGGSSIGIQIDGTNADLARVIVTAADGAPGAAGAAQQKDSTPVTAHGSNGGAGCLGMMTAGAGASGLMTCGAPPADGGLGGAGTNST